MGGSGVSRTSMGIKNRLGGLAGSGGGVRSGKERIEQMGFMQKRTETTWQTGLSTFFLRRERMRNPVRGKLNRKRPSLNQRGG